MASKYDRHNLVGTAPSTKLRRPRTVIWIGSLAVLFAMVFGVSFLYFRRSQRQQLSAKQALDKSLPPTNLIGPGGVQLNDQALRKGKALLVFMSTDCKPCDNELDFLKRVYGKRKDVSFYGIVSFGSKDSLKEAANKYPFGIYLDGGGLAHRLSINRVPVKLFVNEGQMLKTWGGATNSPEAQAEFVKWLESVQ